MELDDAILHLEESLSDEKKEWSCESCKQEHVQLLNWLKDYKSLIERPKAEWVYKKFDKDTGIANSCFCSRCGYPQGQVYLDFCAKCGADMR